MLVLICLIIPIYSNTLHVPWHYDDQPNIVANRHLHLRQFDVESVKKTFFTVAGREKFSRPLSSFSFALNWYLGGDDTFGYHIVNLGIHVLTAFFLYLSIYQLFNTPALLGRFSVSDAAFISLFGAVLWAVNPIQTQAVTYIVQRMAQMAALFYIAGMFFYVKARLSCTKAGRWYWLPTVLMFACALLSKENAVLFPVALFLLEILFVNPRVNLLSKRTFVLFCCILVGVGITGYVLSAKDSPLFFLQGYLGRPFSISERLLTEPRIVLFYLSQIFYPLPSRLSVTHDIVLSQSLFNPPTTFGAIILILLIIFIALRYRRRFPLFSFGVLFYFGNHALESTVIPLELIFEHRNYLPSLFLFVPIASGIRILLHRYQTGNRFVFFAILFCLLTITIGWGRFTYERNMVWQSPETLWYDAMAKAPNQPGPINNVAVLLGWGPETSREKKELAVGLLDRALKLEHPNYQFRSRMYDNLGTLLADLGRFDQAEGAYRKAIQSDPGFLKAKHHLALCLTGARQWEKALAAADNLIKTAGDRAGPEYYQTRGVIRLWMDAPEDALASFEQALLKAPYRSPELLYYTGSALSRTGQYDRAQCLYRLAQNRQPLRIRTFFLMIENSARAGDSTAAEQYAKILFSEFDVYDIFTTMKKLPLPGRTGPLEKRLVTPVLKTVFYDIGREAEEKGVLPK